MPPPVRSAPTRGEPSLAPVQVSYYRRMKLQRVYPVTVRWRKGAAPVAGQKVTLRLLMAGAQVLPTEQSLDAGKPDATVTFHVTPLARGWLRAQRLEIIHDGRKVQEVPLASKATTQRVTWILLLLTFLAPWFVNTHVRNSPFRERAEFIHSKAADQLDTLGVKVYRENLKKDDIKRDIDHAIRDNVPEMPGFLDEWVPTSKLVEWRASAAGTYAELILASRDQPYSFYAAMIFLGATLLSAATHADMRRKRVSKPIELSAAARASMNEDVEKAMA